MDIISYIYPTYLIGCDDHSGCDPAPGEVTGKFPIEFSGNWTDTLTECMCTVLGQYI